MSGIAGIIHFDGRPASAGEVEGMTAAMDYRGPHGIHHWVRGPVALGHCMLRTTPESHEEAQPLANEDQSLVLVMDGRVDNWEELRRELLGQGAVLRTRADAELVLRAYETWGEECLPRIDGDFAFVISDSRRQRVFCALDRVGSRQLHYWWNGRTLVFATDLHAILSLPWIPQALNENVLHEMLGLLEDTLEETLWKGVTRLLPAHRMQVDSAGPRIGRYWFPDMHATLPCRGDGEYIEYHRSLLADIVRRMSRASDPLACDVSGGLDSSAIFALAETMRQRGELRAPGLEGYCLDFRGDPLADELEYARAVGAYLGRSIHEIAPAQMPLDWHRDYARRFREVPELPHFSMSRSIASAARSHDCRVLLKGLGGDEWLGAFGTYSDAMADWNGGAFMDRLRRDVAKNGARGALNHFLRQGLLPFLPEQVKGGLRLALGRGPRRASPPPSWLSATVRESLQNRRHAAPVHPGMPVPPARRGKASQIGFLTRVKFIRYGVVELLNASLGLEVRRPFWDARLIQAAIATPEYLRRRGNEIKWLHRQAMTGLLPDKILRRTDKAEYSGIFTRYTQDLCRSLSQDVLPRRAGWVDPAEIEAMIRQCEDQGEYPPSSNVSLRALWMLYGADAVAGSIERNPT